MLSDNDLLGLLCRNRVRSRGAESIAQRPRPRASGNLRLANDLPDHHKPGVVFVGVHDDGTCANLPITDERLRTLSDMRSDGNILPFPMMTVQKKLLDGCELAVVEVQPSYSPPVRYNGRVWVRVGPRRATATADEERRLSEKRCAGDLPFDQRPVQNATINDLDLDLFRQVYLPSAVAADVLAANERPPSQQLASLRFVTAERTPNTAAVLVFGKDPLAWFPGAYLQFARFEGPEVTDAIRHQKEISGPMPSLLRQLDKILDANVSLASDVRAGHGDQAGRLSHCRAPAVGADAACCTAPMRPPSAVTGLLVLGPDRDSQSRRALRPSQPGQFRPARRNRLS